MATAKNTKKREERNETGRISLSPFSLALWEYNHEKGALIPLLQAAQNQYSYIPESAIYRISGVTGIPTAEIYGVVTFYKQFRLKAPGRHIIRVCDGTACHVNGSTTIMNVLKEILGIDMDETTDDGIFTLQSVACLGCCSLAPVMMVDSDTYGRLNPVAIREILDKYRKETG